MNLVTHVVGLNFIRLDHPLYHIRGSLVRGPLPGIPGLPARSPWRRREDYTPGRPSRAGGPL